MIYFTWIYLIINCVYRTAADLMLAMVEGHLRARVSNLASDIQLPSQSIA